MSVHADLQTDTEVTNDAHDGISGSNIAVIEAGLMIIKQSYLHSKGFSSLGTQEASRWILLLAATLIILHTIWTVSMLVSQTLSALPRATGIPKPKSY
jgi:hypothetical protein